MADRVYLDWNATAPLRVEARAAMVAAMDVVGNPSSVHAEGRAATGLVEKARAQVVEAFGADRGDLIFVSGATEAASMVLSGASRVFASPVEHDCIDVFKTAVPDWVELGVDGDGLVDPSILSGMDVTETDILAVQAANSETGVIQNSFDTASSVSGSGTLVLCDLVQMAGKRPVAINWQPPAAWMISAHKFGGPKGVGALVVPEGYDGRPLISGGGQEMGRRSGTENVIGIVGFGAAAEAAGVDLANGEWERVGEMRDSMEEMILDAAPEAIVFGKDAPRLPNTSNFAIPHWKGETQVMQMDLAGFAVSAGSACSSGKVKTSRVLSAMGFDDVTASSAIRVSMGPSTKQEDVTRFADVWIDHYRRFKRRAA